MGQVTQDEYLKISDLLHSENVKEIMQFMSVQYAGSRQEYCGHLLGLIPQIAQANVKRMADDIVLHRLAVNTLETMLPRTLRIRSETRGSCRTCMPNATSSGSGTNPVGI